MIPSSASLVIEGGAKLILESPTASGNTAGGTLELGPGVEVTVPSGAIVEAKAGSAFSFGVSAGLIVEGTLNATGSAARNVQFKRSGTSGTWNGIAITGGTSTISYADISYCGTGVRISGNSAVTMEHCTVTNASIGVEVYPPSDDDLTYIHEIRHCSFDVTAVENFVYGLATLGGSSPVLEDGGFGGCNVIAGNQTGVSCQEGSSPVLGFISELGDDGGLNSIYNNSVFDIDTYTDEMIFAENNYWTHKDDPTQGFSCGSSCRIEYEPWLTEPPECGTSKMLAGKG